ncbi:hypothetical protein CPJCM30710_18630 [Clostridium polyendosporum]|uniref:SPOR domain-containing protein n=1 Tax=Clostridium polyendosporum TaxID=69208 RepID=A0A919RZQ6_9CLOT|nr:SPOR domain-containing protein [Clostridium polyendosporum]GIM29197.1 hypothetical protein CPJCM30710_18630 [Clostridium polyendosporum]
MKYTRYDLRRRKKESSKIFVFFGMIIITAVIVGTILAKIIFNGNIVPKKSIAPINNSSIQNSKEEGLSFIFVQCGFYAKKENAEEVRNQLKERYNTFYLIDNDKIRVGVYFGTAEEADKLSKQLTTEGINNLKITFQVAKKDLCTSEIGEMVSGYLQILHKLEEKDVKSVKTSEFKAWTNSLKEDSKSENIEVFREFKKNINELPEEISRENLEGCYNAIFKVLNPFKVR